MQLVLRWVVCTASQMCGMGWDICPPYQLWVPTAHATCSMRCNGDNIQRTHLQLTHHHLLCAADLCGSLQFRLSFALKADTWCAHGMFAYWRFGDVPVRLQGLGLPSTQQPAICYFCWRSRSPAENQRSWSAGYFSGWLSQVLHRCLLLVRQRPSQLHPASGAAGSTPSALSATTIAATTAVATTAVAATSPASALTAASAAVTAAIATTTSRTGDVRQPLHRAPPAVC